MDISALHTATENLAEWLSEVTQGDLGQPTPVPDQDVGDLYLHLIERNTSITSVLTTETEPLRQHAHLMCRSARRLHEFVWRRVRGAVPADCPADRGRLRIHPFFWIGYCIDGVDLDAGAIYERHVNETVIHTWDLAQAMGFDYLPAAEVAHQIRTALQKPPLENADAVWECALRLSGRV